MNTNFVRGILKLSALATFVFALFLLTAPSRAGAAEAAQSTNNLATNGLGMKFAAIPAGRFMRGMQNETRLRAMHPHTILMGDLVDERPAHTVQLTRPFLIGVHEVTRAQFRTFVEEAHYTTDAEKSGRGALAFNPPDRQSIDRFVLKANCTWRNPGFEQQDDHPVVCISWHDAVAFCEWLSQREDASYRLPTEAEWEYAALAGATTTYVGGDDPDSIYAFGNIGDAALEAKYPGTVKRQRADHLAEKDGDGFVFTAPVGSFRANAWGLCDTHGNVWEWCSDRYYDRYYESLVTGGRKSGKSALIVDPRGPETTPQHEYGDWRSMRGGAWNTGPMASRCASRAFADAGDAFVYTGFRVVKDLPPGKAVAAQVARAPERQEPETSKPANPATAPQPAKKAGAALLADPAEEQTWRWLLERARRKEYVERDPQGNVKWISFLDEAKQRGDFYAGSLTLDAAGHVERMTFNSAHFKNEEFERLAKFSKLRFLTAWHNGDARARSSTNYSGAGLRDLKDLPLETINVGGSLFNDEGLKAASELPSLLELKVYHTRITNAGMRVLRNNDRIVRLHISARLTDACLEDVATMSKLEELQFDDIIFTWEGGLKHLASLKDQLKTFKSAQSLIADADMEQLRAALPNTKIDYTPAKPEQIRELKKLSGKPAGR